MYIVISAVLTILAISEALTHKSSKNLSLVVWGVLTFLLCFRYGQGTDYFNYLAQYEYVDVHGLFSENTLYHGEHGWYILMLLAKRLGMSFELFVGIISFVMMILIRRGIEKYSPYKVLSYLILFPTYYMTYCNAAIRQALVLALFIGFGIQFLVEKKEKKYIFLIVCSSLIHSSGLLLLAPLFVSFKFTKKNILYLIPFAVLTTFLFYRFSASFISQFSFSSYIKESYSVGGVLIRVIMCYVIFKLSKKHVKQNNESRDISVLLFDMYMLGFAIFMAFSFSGTFAQRLTMPFKALEVLLIPMLISQNAHATLQIRKRLMRIVLFLALLLNVELIKNIDSYIEQGEYRSDINALNYPYVSVFDESDIYKYRTRFISE